MAKLSIRDIDLKGKRVLVRVDYNVPLDDNGAITDETRIRETLPTLDHLYSQGAKVILMAHLGRPKGKPDPKFTLRNVAKRLADVVCRPVAFVDDCVGEKVEKTVGAMQNGDTLVLENVRYYGEEEKNDPEFSKKLAKIADVYVNDAFGAAHRAHASTEGVTRHVGKSAMGLLMEKELKFLGEELAKPAKPFVVILGGAKVSDKITVIDALLDKCDVMLIGGAMAYTFKFALDEEVGKSLCERDKKELALSALEKAKARGVKLLLPVDNLITQEFKAGAKTQFTTPGQGIPADWEGVDIGPETVKLYSEEIAKAGTILWNGPMGVFEIPDFSKGTFEVARAIAANGKCTSIIGGGDSVKAVKKAKVADRMTFVSTGGGASLEFLEGRELPGVAALSDK
ncbi:MAG: phosphoglycerate kinase [Verrucomicrobiae bacterium]|nr:phosphoglycerate kinase [Verrucomicrobiae bacterium]